MKKLGRLLAVCALLGLLLTGCNMPLEENRQVEDLLRARSWRAITVPCSPR
ncbi:hypothetical protein [Faecalibacterium sp. OF04-11AC]|uniref:hypothetical protein n=1 Tax=Faecalibacterium sp. OF04-11AC TaxID=2293109 RepID=UPI001FA8F5E9|nr:hypothetical protein [Faecalibacterium sp. OF04-11AC]